MVQIVECVPNFSEGRNKDVIEAIATAIRGSPMVTLLDVDPGASTNRTVYTFVGTPDACVEAAIRAAKTAFPLIDMRKQKGSHPRNSAMDVCPFVPVANVTMEDCIACANKFGKRMGEELSLPTYLYEEACVKGDYRKTLRQLRADGEYEGLEEKLKKPEWAPDFGPTDFVPTWGVTATGARNFLIAYNVNILGTKEQSHRIALNVREQGRKVNGETQPGRLKGVKGMGWFVEEYGFAQVSMNLDNFREVPPHVAFEECKKDAEELNLAVAGSEIVGLIPLDALLMAADYYIKKENLFILEEKIKVKLAIERLGLNSCKTFDPQTRVIEYIVADSLKPKNRLIDLTLEGFIRSVQARTSAPGGGSVSACAGALGAALGQMMGWMSFGNKEWSHLDEKMRKLIAPFHDKVNQLISCIDADTDAFADFMAAIRMPKNTDEEKKAREIAMQAGLKQATLVPLNTVKLSSDRTMWECLMELAEIGNMNSASDLEVGCKMLEAGAWGAHRNIIINTPQIDDSSFVTNVINESLGHLEFIQQNLKKLDEIITKRREEKKK